MAKRKPTDRDVLKATLKWLAKYAPMRWRNELYDSTIKVPVREVHDAYCRIERQLEGK